MARPREFDEAEVIDAAERVFWTRGYDDTSVSDLLGATGLGRASLYASFGGKDELLLRVLERHRLRLGDSLRHLREAPSGLAGVRAFFLDAIELATSSDGKGCLIAQTSSSVAAHAANVARELDSIIAERKAALRHALSIARRNGELRDGKLDEQVAYLLMLAVGISGAARAGVSRKELGHSIEIGLRALAAAP